MKQVQRFLKNIIANLALISAGRSTTSNFETRHANAFNNISSFEHA